MLLDQRADVTGHVELLARALDLAWGDFPIAPGRVKSAGERTEENANRLSHRFLRCEGALSRSAFFRWRRMICLDLGKQPGIIDQPRALG